MISILWDLIKPILWPLIGMVAVVSLFLFYGHTRYTAGYNKAKVQYEVIVAQVTQERDDAVAAHKKDLDNWTKMVANWQKEIDTIKSNREVIVKKGATVYRDRVRTIIKEKESAPKVEYKPADVVIAPDGFRVLHDHAAASSYTALGRAIGPLPPYSERATGKTETFEASAFTEAIIGNYNQYNELAAQCDALITIIEEFNAMKEKTNDPNLRGTQGAPDKAR